MLPNRSEARRPSRWSTLPILALLATPPIAAASDLFSDDSDAFAEPIDLRLGVGTATGSYQVENIDAGTSSAQSFSQPVRLTLSWVGFSGLHGWGGWLWGLGADFTDLPGGDLGDGR